MAKTFVGPQLRQLRRDRRQTQAEMAKALGLPVWKAQLAFRLAGVIIPQFVELPDGDRFFTISRTVDRPTVNFDAQDHRLAISLGCELKYAKKLGYAAAYNHDDERIFSRIGINCHVCLRQACSQRAHQPFFMHLPLDTSRRGKTRYES